MEFLKADRNRNIESKSFGWQVIPLSFLFILNREPTACWLLLMYITHWNPTESLCTREENMLNAELSWDRWDQDLAEI